MMQPISNNARILVKVFIIVSLLSVVILLFSQAFLQRVHHIQFGNITEIYKIQVSEPRKFSTGTELFQNLTHSPFRVLVGKPRGGKAFLQRVQHKPYENITEIDKIQVSETRKFFTATVLFQNLTHSPFRVLAGKPRGGKGALTIGIPSARRPNTNVIYLMFTLNSIIQATTEDEKARTTIVILLSDTNTTYITEMSEMIYHKFSQYCETGVINVIELSQEVYPDLDHVRKTFNDDKLRLKWRAKQNIDYAYLMYYCREISEYYLQLEDDVIAAGGFIKDIDAMIARQKSKWFLLDFSNLGFIGKLFKTSDLVWTSEFLLANYDVAPGDLQLSAMRAKHDQNKPIAATITLFQHIGKFSSLQNKIQPLIDTKFKEKDNTRVEVDEIPAGHYPPADIETSLDVHMNYTPSNAYDGNVSTFFWGKSPKKDDFLMLTFQKPRNFSRILVLSGHPISYNDRIISGDLTAATLSLTVEKNNQKCEKFENIVTLVEGQVDTLATGSRIPYDIICLSVHFTKQSNKWAIIREIRLVR